MLLTTGQSPRNAGLSRTSRWIIVLGFFLFAADVGSPLVWAQDRPGGSRDSLDLISRYRMARYRLLAQQFVSQMPMRVLPPESIPTGLDSLVGPSPDTVIASAENDPAFPIEDLHSVSHLERSWFQNQYGETEWAFLGSGPRLTALDTTRTRELRARLQTHFGAPTYTPTERNLDQWHRRPESSRDELVQFAYWFVVNDSIPVRVTDVNGPMERGLIVSTDRAYRDHLVALRTTLLRPLRREERTPYVDYYYDEETRRWYRVGFDGRSFFRKPISRHDIVQGRRPRLERERSAPASSASPDSSGTP